MGSKEEEEEATETEPLDDEPAIASSSQGVTDTDTT